VSERKAFLLRIDPAILSAIQQWADDELRSVNGQIEFVLRRALSGEGRLIVPERDAGAEEAS
jgi:hypothetical protein